MPAYYSFELSDMLFLRWTAYQIGQRVGDHFSKLDRVFLAGGKRFSSHLV